MISGRLTLKNIDSALQQVRGGQHELDEKIQRATTKLARLRQQEAASYRKLAELRIDQIEDELLEQLDRADQRARELLEQRQDALSEARSRTRESLQRQTGLEEERQRQNRLLEEAAKQLEYQLEQTHSRLAEDQAYVSLMESAQIAVDTAAAAEEKTLQSEQDQQTKGLPYRSDKLFMYLWNRGYGTTQYRTNPLARTLDRWVARHIGFEQARRNYFMLQEIPKRLREHTQRLEQEASKAMAATEQYERQQEIADGVETLENNVASLQQVITELDQKLEQEEQHYAGLLKDQEAFATGEDALFQKAIAVLVSNFQSQPIPELRAEAEASYGYSDDSEVRRLAKLRRDKANYQNGLEEQRVLHQRAAERLHQLEDIRSQFKRSRYDAPNSRFSNGDTLEIMLSEFLRGLISANRLWRTLRKSQRFIKTRSDPYPGGISLPGGIRLPKGRRIPRGIRIPGGWGGGGGGGGGGGRRSGGIRMPKIPRGGGGKSGGFRTGGGF